VQRVWLNSSRACACIAITLFVRVVLELKMLETIFYAPVIGYSSFKFFQWWEKRRNILMLMKLKTPDMISESKL
jgi:pseudouridine-5'-phosphate glycosidase